MGNTTIEISIDRLFELIEQNVRYGIARDCVKEYQYIERDKLMLMLGIDEEEKETDHEQSTTRWQNRP